MKNFVNVGGICYHISELRDLLYSVGYRLEKIGERKEKKKMTREEFKNKYKEIFEKDKKYTNEETKDKYANQMVEWYEALGIMKFEEEKVEYDFKAVLTPFGEVTVKNDVLIKHLEDQGYKVTKNG